MRAVQSEKEISDAQGGKVTRIVFFEFGADFTLSVTIMASLSDDTLRKVTRSSIYIMEFNL